MPEKKIIKIVPQQQETIPGNVTNDPLPLLKNAFDMAEQEDGGHSWGHWADGCGNSTRASIPAPTATISSRSW